MFVYKLHIYRMIIQQGNNKMGDIMRDKFLGNLRAKCVFQEMNLLHSNYQKDTTIL